MKNDSATLGDRIIEALGKRKKATTEELAKSLRVSEKDVYSRAWWLEEKEGLVKSTGRGRTRTWKLTAAAIKALSAS